MVAVLLSFLSLIVFSLRLTGFPLKNWDEAWYAEITKNLTSGHYSPLVPFWNGQYYFDKPPLYFWLSYPIVRLFGVGEWQVRLVSVLAAVLCVILIYKIGLKLFSQRVGLFAALIFLSLGQVILRFQEGNLDSLLLLTFLASIYFFLNSQKPTRLLLSGLCLGAGYLVKSWGLGLFPVLFMVCYTLIVNKKFLKPLILIFLVSVLVSSWWFILGAREFGPKFLDWYLFHPGAGNFSLFSYLDFSYLKSFFLDIGLWWLPLTYLFHEVKKFSLSRMDTKKLLFLALPLVGYFLITNLSAEKFSWYLLPLYPFLSLILALVFSLSISYRQHLIRPLLLIAFIGQLFLIYNFHAHDPDRSMVGAVLGLAVKDKIPPDGQVVLDDRDFASFLYYSNHAKIFVAQQGGGKSREYWIIDYSQVKNLPPNVWIVTPIIQHFADLPVKEMAELPFQYHLLKVLY